MISNAILDEVRRVKEELTLEANHDIHAFCEQTRVWVAQHPHKGPVVRTAEEIRRHYEFVEGAAVAAN